MYNFEPILQLTHLQTAALKAYFTVGERLSAKVLQSITKERALVRLKGIDMEVTTQIPLQREQRLLLRVAEVGEEYFRFEIIERAAHCNELFALREYRKERRLFWQEFHQELLQPLQKEFPLLLHPKDLSAKRLKKVLQLLHPKSDELQKLLDARLEPAKIQEFLTLLQLLWLSGSISKSFTTILPLEWEGLEESSIVIKKLHTKDAYYCRLQLRFDLHDRVAATFILHKKFLNLYLAIEDEEFREDVEEQLHELKRSLSGGKVAVNIFVKEYNDDDGSHLVGEHFIKKRV